MRPRRLAAVCLLAMTAALLPPAAAPARAKVFDPATFTLDNGLQVVVVTNARAPVVTHQVWYKAGSADEPPGKSGIAHYLEHLMFKGTESLGPGEFSRIVARNGGRDNAFTSLDYTGYHQTVAADRLELVMRMEAERMRGLKVPPSEAGPELQVVLEERRQRTDSEPAALFYEQVQAALHLNHPYRIPVIGWRAEIERLTLDDALAFHRERYSPNNAVLLIAGAVTPEEARRLAEIHYGPIPARPAPPRVRPAEPPRLGATRLEWSHPRVRQVSWSRRWLAPAYANDPDGRAYPLDVAAELMGGGATGRLHRALVAEQGVALSVGADYEGSRLDLGQFAIYATPRPGVETDALERAIDAVLTELLAEGPTADEVALAKRSLAASAIYARDSLNAAPRAFGAALTTGGSVADVEAWPERIAAVTAEQVAAALRAVLAPDRAVTAVLSPKPAE